MSEIDKLLAQLKTEYEKPPASPSAKNSTPVPTTAIKPPSQADSLLDSLLAEVKAEFNTQTNPPQKQPTPEIPSPSPKLEDKSFPKQEKPQSKPQSNPQPIPEITKSSPSPSKLESSVLQDLQAEFQEHERTEKQRREAQLKEQQHLEEQRKQRRRQALQQQAQEWLKRLNPKSEEGKWFEDFSYSYESKLEAAIDYLEALRESGVNR